MSQAATYILTVTGAAILAAILQSLAGQGTMGALIRLLGGIFLALVVISPVVELELPDPAQWFREFTADGEAAAASGEELAEEARQTIIKDELEAYILDKAAQIGASVTVEVTLSEAGTPDAVKLAGAVSAETKSTLTHILMDDLGLKEEAVIWSEQTYASG